MARKDFRSSRAAGFGRRIRTDLPLFCAPWMPAFKVRLMSRMNRLSLKSCIHLLPLQGRSSNETAETFAANKRPKDREEHINRRRALATVKVDYIRTLGLPTSERRPPQLGRCQLVQQNVFQKSSLALGDAALCSRRV